MKAWRGKFSNRGLSTLWGALLMTSLCVLLGGCGNPEAGTDSTSQDAAHSRPKPDLGDPSVPAELGGPGFTGKGWITAKPGPLGDPRAKRGGEFVTYWLDWPNTLRPYGINSDMQSIQLVNNLCYETLCSTHPDTMEPIPSLASHWKISDDKMKFTFRIDPRAHWSDGKPVVADDVLATFRLIMDPSLLEPGMRAVLSNMKEPKVLSKYMLEVECKEKHWRNFIRFTSMRILPDHEIHGMSGKEFLRKYNYHYLVGSGPYKVFDEKKDIVQDEHLSVTRRDDYWGDDDEMNRGLNNFDRIRFDVVGGDRLPFDKVCKGDLDFYEVSTARWWVEEVVGLDGKSQIEAVRKGWLIPQKVFTRAPEGYQGDVFNMRKPPLDDVRVRLALAHLFDRKTLIKKFAYDQYLPLKSYFPGGDFENLDNKMVDYDPQKALELLKEAGFTQRDTDGVLMRNGERLSVTLSYGAEGFGKYFTAFKESCRKVGVEINLTFIDEAAATKAFNERTFQMSGIHSGASMTPDPRPDWYSTLADDRGSANYSGFKSKEADKLIDQYDRCFDLQERNKLLRQLDGVIFNQHPCMLEWYMPYQRVMWWDKFGMPDKVFTKYGDWTDALTTWWYDPDKAARLEKARQAGEALRPTPPLELHPWDPTQAQPKQASK